jgi:hypothetical protein
VLPRRAWADERCSPLVVEGFRSQQGPGSVETPSVERYGRTGKAVDRDGRAKVKNRKVLRLFILTAFFCVAALLAVLAFSTGSPRSDITVSVRPSPSDWRIGTGYINFGPPNKRPRYFQLGPFVMTWGMKAIAEEFMRQVFVPLGTNSLTAGTLLYNPTTTQQWAKVLNVQDEFEFEDGTNCPGVLIERKNGTEWVPRASLNKILIQEGHWQGHRDSILTQTYFLRLVAFGEAARRRGLFFI